MARIAAALVPLVPDEGLQFRCANLAYRHALMGRHASIVATLKDGARFELDLSEWPQAQAYLRRSYDPNPATVRFVKAHLPNGGTFFDVGAHIGLITFQVLKEVPGATAHAFEPHPRAAESFARNSLLNNAGPRAILSKVALSHEPGTLRFDVERHRVDDASIEEVACWTLDNYIEDHEVGTIDVMKLDVEGHERSVLAGAANSLAAGGIRAVTMESMSVHGDTAAPIQTLLDAGYRQTDMHGRSAANVAFLLP